FRSSLGTALQWRLLLLWLLATLVPALLVATPLWTSLQAQFGHSVHAAVIAAGDDLPLLLEGLGEMGEHAQWLAAGLGGTGLLMLLLAPWLTGLTVAPLRAGRRPGRAAPAAGCRAEYRRTL